MSTSLRVFSTVANHPLGRDLHLRNLRWAIGNAPITLFTFAKYGFESIHGESYMYGEENKGRHCDFHGNYLPSLAESTNNLILLIQQDIFFSRKPDFLNRSEDIIMPSDYIQDTLYFAILDECGKIIFPRLWEGGYFYRECLLYQAARAGVSLGYSSCPPETPTNYYFLNPSTKSLISCADWVKNPPQNYNSGDKLVALGFWAQLNYANYYAAKPYLTHFQGPEKTHWRNPEVYNDPSLLKKDKNIDLRSLGNIALMYYISGVWDKSLYLNELLNHDHNGSKYKFISRLKMLHQHADEWMTEDQYCRLRKVMGNLLID